MQTFASQAQRLLTCLREYFTGEWHHLKRTVCACRPAVKPALCLFAVYLVGISALLRADFNYIDDLGRVALGYHSWHTTFGRFASTVLAVLLHADTYLTDVSPLGQIIAAAVVTVAGIILIRAFSDREQIRFWDIVAVIPLGLSPYFLECLSYKYDSPYMALSLLAGIFPLLFVNYRKPTYVVMTALSTLLMCTTYQAASGIFPIVIAFYSLHRWNRGGDLVKQLKFIGLSAAGYIAGLLFFVVFLMRQADTYADSTVFPLSELVPGIAANLTKYLNTILSDFKREWLILIALMCAAFIFITVLNSKQNRLAALALSVAVLLVSAALCFGIYLALISPIFRPRGMYGFGVFLALVALPIMSSEKKYPLKVICVILCWCFFSFALTYGNALAEQQRYTDFRIQMVIDDLNELDVMQTDTVKTVQLSGDIGRSPVIDNMPQDYNMLNRLIPKTFGGYDWIWNGTYFYYYFGMENVVSCGTLAEDFSTYDLPVLKETMYHDILGDESRILIKLK